MFALLRQSDFKRLSRLLTYILTYMFFQISATDLIFVRYSIRFNTRERPLFLTPKTLPWTIVFRSHDTTNVFQCLMLLL